MFNGIQQIAMDELIMTWIREYFIATPPLLVFCSNHLTSGQNHSIGDFDEITSAGFERRALDTWSDVDFDTDGGFIDSNQVTNTNEESHNIIMRGWFVLDGVDNTKVLGWWTQNVTGDFGPGASVTQYVRWRNGSKYDTPQ